jgi:hypothetical protein
MDDNQNIVPVEVYAGTIWEAGLVKSLLEDSGIQTFLGDENIGTIAPWYSAPGGAGSVKVIVSNLDYESAKLIIAEYEKNAGRVDFLSL